MLSVIRAVLVVALSSISAVVSAATAHRQATDAADLFIGLYTQEQPFVNQLFLTDIFYSDDRCRCDKEITVVPAFIDDQVTIYNECLVPNARISYEHGYSCRCHEPPSFRAADDNIRDQMAFSEDPLSILPLWEVDVALEIEEHVRLAWDDSGCGSGSIGSLGGLTSGRSLSSSYGAGGLGGALPGGGSIGGGSGPLIPVSPPLEDSPIFETPSPVPLPPAGFLFLTALSALGLLGGLRRRFAAKA